MVEVMTKVKNFAHLSGHVFNQYVRLSSHGNWRYSKFIAEVKNDGHSWGLAFNQYVPFSFHGNQTISTEVLQIKCSASNCKVKVMTKVRSDSHI